MLHICEIKAYKGRNIYSHQKVIKMIVDLGDWENVPSKQIPGFNEKLLLCLPGLKDHHCSLGHPGGFQIRLREGTYLAHIIEHSALEILNMLGCKVSFGRARQIGDSSMYYIVYAYNEERSGIEAGRLAVSIANTLIAGESLQIDKDLERIRDLSNKNSLGPSTQAVVDAALERGIPVTRIGNGGIIQLGYGKYSQKIECTLTDNTSCISVDISCDKTVTNELLSQSGIPVPRGIVCYSSEEAVEASADIGYPVVVKPINGNQGKGVSLYLQTAEEVVKAYNIAKAVNEMVLVEEYVKGRDYRVLVVGKQVSAVAMRIPAHVVGDGVHTIAELVSILNRDSRRGEDHEKPMTKVVLDEISLNLLAKHGYTPESIPEAGVYVHLKYNGNISTGGEAVDVTDRIHPYNQEIAIRAARIIGLDIAGVDITCADIANPISAGNGAVIEVNAAPGIRMHLYPSKGKPRRVGDAIVDMLFPSGSKHSIPIVSVTGTNGKTTTTRMIAHILRTQGNNVGMTTTSGIYLNDKCIMKGDTTGPASAKVLLTDKAVDAAVLETARGGIIRSGLGYDLSDVGVLLNITEDHLGLDGVETLEDLLHVKSLVVEAVKSNGYAVLNADDPMVVQAAKRVKANIIYFSVNEDNLVVHKHICEGGIAVFLKDGYITIATGNGLIQSIPAQQIPATHGGKLAFNIENSLAAISAAYALKVPIQAIEGALLSFCTDEFHNPGRFNVYNIRDFRVIVDYGHNIDGYRRVVQALKKFGASRLIGIIGVPGDRNDNSIRQIGVLAGKSFNRIYIKEDVDLRGRQEGEVAALLKKGALSAGMPGSMIVTTRYETDALRMAMDEAVAGDLIIVFYENLEGIQNIINGYIGELQNNTNMKEPLLLKA